MQITTTIDDHGVALITLDDGGKNVLTLDAIAAWDKAIVDAAEAKAIVTAGREGALSAGLDLAHVKAHGAKGAKELVLALGEPVMRLWTDPRPTVCAATGHAIAGGTIIAMAHDHVVAAADHWKWGLTETRVNLEVPAMGLALARARLSPRDLHTYVLPGTPVDAAMAVAIGYADELADLDECVDRAVAVARERASLPAAAYAGNKARLRGDLAAQIIAGADADVDLVVRHLEA